MSSKARIKKIEQQLQPEEPWTITIVWTDEEDTSPSMPGDIIITWDDCLEIETS